MTPQLRFPEFTDEWQVKKLGDLLKIGSGRDYKHLETGNIPVYGTGGLMLYVNDYLYDGKSIGIGRKGTIDQPQLLTGKFWTVDTLFYTYDHTASAPEFLYAIFQKVNWQKWNEASGVPSLSKTTIENIKVAVPKELEQEKIAEFLAAVDERIAAGEKKLELLKKYKKGVMQKIFTQAIRFKDEEGNHYSEWEEKNIGDIMTERNTQAPKSSDYPLMAFVAYKGVAPKGDRYNREFLVGNSDGKKYKKTEYGDFIYSSNNLETGSIGLNLYGSASISPVYSIFQISNSCDPKFLGSYMLRKRFVYEMTRYRQGVVYGQWRIHESDFLKIKERIPSLEEQQKIATFLTALDTKIAAEQTRLTAAKQWKRGLLQRMFV